MKKIVNGKEKEMSSEEAQAWLDSLPVVDTQVKRVTALAALRAIDAAGLATSYEAWTKSKDRTFLERAFIDKALYWEFDDPIVRAGASAMGLTEEQLKALFNTVL